MTKCLFCDGTLSLIHRLRDEQFCDEEHRRRYLQESRWKGVPLWLDGTAPSLAGLIRYDPGCSPVDAPRRAMHVRPLAFPKAQRAWPSANQQSSAEFSLETQVPFALAMPAARNAPRRRFVYKWANQEFIKEAIRASAAIVRLAKGIAVKAVCAPIGEALPVDIDAVTPAGETPLRWQAMTTVDQTTLDSVRIVGAIEAQERSLPQLSATGAAVAVSRGIEALKTETPLVPLESTRGQRGVYIPLVSLPLLRPRIAFGPRTATSPRTGERPGVIIPIREFQQPSERVEAPPLARII